MSESSRYLVGVDLGTTNCALAYVDTQALTDEHVPIEQFAVAQLINAGEVAVEPLLPSYLYIPAPGEIAEGQLALPWAKKRDFAVGRFARDHGAKVPTRLISSAKSWLCHPGVDRRGAILPWAAEEDFPKISPLEASVRLLEHLRDAWNAEMAGGKKEHRLENQEIVLTVPASFDAVARELTVEAARQAGLEHVTLFEEPQAAFYAWLHASGDEWRRIVRAGDVVVVVDVGGGTTDLTLIGVGEADGNLDLNRLAVGDHLLLGGDNMDLALAHQLAEQLKSTTKLDATQMLGLWHACRGAKEKLFANRSAESQSITVLGRGRKVIGGSLRAELRRDTVEQVLVDGFFPRVKLGDFPQRPSSIGLHELGLSYETDPAVTRHLSAFLTRHQDSIKQYRTTDEGKSALPSVILFNGGVFQAEPLRRRVLDLLTDWSGQGEAASVRELTTAGLDLAVARGAAYYGLVRRGRGVRIRGGVARSYYIGVETAMPAVPGMPRPIKALCVVPHGMEEGTEAELPNKEFGLVVGQPVEFRFLGSTQRKDDQVGTIVEEWEETIEELAPLQTSLEAKEIEGETVPVRLHAKVTEVGTMEVWFESLDKQRRWKLEFNVREP